MRTNICLAILALFVLAPFNGAFSQYTLSVESSAAAGTGGTVYRFYVNANDDTDKISAVFGNNESNLVISTPDNIFNSAFNSSWNASGINPAFLPLFPDLADDSYATINLEGPASTSGLAGAADPSIVEDASLSPTVSGYFTAGGTELNVSTLVGASWYVLNTAANALPVDGRWLIAQITTTGAISGQMNYQVFPLGVGDDQQQYSTSFDGVGTFTGTCTLGCDGGTTDVPGCTDSSACNYDSSATVDDGSCAVNDECGVCGGSGIPDGDCDCFGNQVDALGECGGECAEDADGDSICDDVDDCVGQYDACGVCNGDGIAEGACDCDGNQLDACGVCGGSGVDADGDGICDDVDDCVGDVDGCGVCNGDGTTCTGCTDPAASNYSADNIFEDNGQCLYATTFNVDMSCATNAGAMLNGSSSFYEVFVTGPFAGWAANDGWNQLTDDDGDGVYSVTLDFAAGDVEYKYAIDGFADQEQLVDDMQNGGDCAPVTDYAGYANRQVAAGSTTSDTYGSCSSCADQIDPVNITFQVDMNQYAEAYAYGGVFVNGSFNGWCGGCNPMDDTDGDGVWSVTLPLMPGTVEYKFTLDGWNYQEEFAGGESCTSTIDGFTNRSLTFDAETVLEAVCWESCAACPTTSDVFGCMDETANNYNADATADPNNACLYDVTLSVDVSQTDFTSVSLAGTFNGWNNASNFMDDSDGDGVYTITVSMSAGDQEYKFLGNGDWAVAEAFDGSESCTTPPAEFVNRVITVAGPTVADTVCYNSCEACVDGTVFGCTDAGANNYNADATQDDGSCMYTTTFNVDMSCAGVSFYEVFVTGPLWGWPANSGWNQLTDADGDGVYSVSLETPAGDVEYKYAIDGFADQENLIDDMQNGASCAPITDYSSYANRQTASGSTTSDTYGSCEACPAGGPGCMDALACNYDSGATEDDGSCTYNDSDIDLSLVWFLGTDQTGVCGDTPYAIGLSYPFQFTVTPGQPSTITLFPEVAAAFNAAGQSGLVYDIENSTYVLCGDEMTIVSPVFGTYVLTWDGTGFVNPNYAGGWLAPQSSFEIGCGDSLACNYDPCTIYWGECFYPESPNLDCDGNCLNDADGDGICDEDETYGCTDEAACNYNPDATNNIAGSGALIAVTAGSWPSEISWTLNGETYGAPFSQEFALDPGTYTISTADSYGDGWNGAVMTITDLGSGEVVTYTLDGSSGSVDFTVTAVEGACYYAPDYYECDGETCLNDTDGDGVCDELEVAGCVVPTACNYVASGVTDLVPCVYPEPGYNCDGTCIGDADGDGVCDANEVVGCQDSTACNYDAAATDEGSCDYTSCLGCTDEAACNYDDAATQDDGSCDFCSCANEAAGGVNGYNLMVEEYAVDGIPGLTTYRVYVTTPNAEDFVSAIAGDQIIPSYLRTSTDFYQNALGGLTAGNINPLFFAAFPEIQYDSWLTIGIDQAPVPGDGTADVTIAQAAGDTWTTDFEAGGNLELNSFFGGSWFTTNLTSNGVAGDDLKVLVAQLTTDGTLTGSLYVQVFPLGVGANAEYLTLSFGSSTCGCTDDTACNYNGDAIYDDGSCFYVGVYDCDANCVNDTDGDGVCDELEIVGCSDAEACNYNADATDEGACEYVEPTLLPSEGGCTLFFSGYAEGSSNHKFMEIYNPTDADIDLAGYAFPNVSNAPSVPGEYEYWNAFPEGAVIAAGDVYVIAHGSADPSILAEADHTFTYLSNGDDGFMLVMGTETDFIMIDAIGDWNGDPGSGWEVAGVANGTQNHSLIRKSDVTSGNGGDWAASAGTNADDSEWIVLDQDDWTGLGSHEFTGNCGAGEYAVIYDCDGVCLNDSDGDGVCDEIEVAGCTDSGACNYDMLATDEDGSCEYLTCAGCTDSEGCNYDDTATIEDGSCTYPDPFLDCAGNCLNDLNINGICDELEVLGCTYTAACNYDADANVDDGECDFSCLLTGCTDPAADNYDAAATVDDGNCFYVGCVDPNGLNYDSGANLPGACEYCEGDFNYDGEVDVNDLLDFFQLWGNTCD